jgi:hypothetical protein
VRNVFCLLGYLVLLAGLLWLRVLILLVLVFLVVWPHRIDGCLDQGGCWDYSNDRCADDDLAGCHRYPSGAW